MKIAKDKQLHFIVGLAIAVVVSALAGLTPLALNPAPAGLFGALVAGVAGYLKEKRYDAKRPDRHTVDMADFRWTLGGGVVGAVLFAFVLTYVKISAL